MHPSDFYMNYNMVKVAQNLSLMRLSDQKDGAIKCSPSKGLTLKAEVNILKILIKKSI